MIHEISLKNLAFEPQTNRLYFLTPGIGKRCGRYDTELRFD